MKRTIYFLRHAKSSWETNVEDLQRPLNSRGKKDALLMSNFAEKQLKRPDFVGVSTAMRTRQTAWVVHLGCLLFGLKSHTCTRLMIFPQPVIRKPFAIVI